MNEYTDEGLALAVHQGTPKAVERLVTAYQDTVFSYACRLVGNRFDAQEVTQDTFIRALRALESQYDEPRCRTLSLRPWLLQITRNMASNRRRTRRRAYEDLAPIPEGTADTTPSADQAVETSEEITRLNRALDLLDRDSRELIVLRFMEEMRYLDIVMVVGMTEAAARGKVFRALRKLRTLLNEQEDDHGV